MCKSRSWLQTRHIKVQLACLLIMLITWCEGKQHVQRINCIPVTECPIYVGILQTVPRTAAHIDTVRSAHCGFEGFIEKVWCPSIIDTSEEETEGPQTDKGLFRGDTKVDKDVPRGGPNIDKDTLKRSPEPLTRTVVTKPRLVVPLFPSPEECGKYNANKILGGEDAEIDEYPWSAMLLYRSQNNSLIAKCGGTLITRKYVLTATHCVNSELAFVLLGEYDTRNETDCVAQPDYIQCAPKPLRLEIDQVIPYPQSANEPIYKNDITLLRLKQDVEFNEFVAPICLPKKTLGYPQVGSTAFSTGWGRWGFTTESKFSSIKQKIGIPVVSRSTCSLAQGITITDGMICAGGVKNKDTCQGDSGGPLMQIDPVSTNWNIIGIVSVSTKTCGTEGVPAVYTWLPTYIDWIFENIKH